jgi:hypothetical protein
MSYIGRGTESISNVEVLDNLTFDGSASYTLQKSSTNFVPSSANNLLISISGVVQQGNFSVSGSTITFDTTVSASDTCDWILHYGTGLITTVADGAITEAKLGSNAVTTAKINNSAVTYAKTDGNFGKIGQVVSSTHTTGFTTSSTSFADTGFDITITPTSTSSKILVTFDIGSVFASTSANGNVCTIYRDDTTDLQGGVDLGHFSRVGANNLFVPIYLQQLDSPNTTSAVKYTLYTRSRAGSEVHAPYNTSYSVAVAMEVLA